MTEAIADKPNPMAPFKFRAFGFYWAARLVWAMATQMQITAMGWQIYDHARQQGASITQGAFLIGLIGLAQFVPLAALSLFGGQAADRYNRRTIILIGLVLKAMLTMALLVGSYLQMQHTAFTSISGITSLVMVVAALTGALNAFMPAASTAMTPNLVDKATMPQAIAMMSLGFQIATIMGPSLGGVLMHGGPILAYGVVTILYFVGLALVLCVPAPAQVRQERGNMVQLIKEGISYVRHNPIVLGAMSLDLGVVWFAGAMALLPVFARDILHADAIANGVLRSAFAVGAALMALKLALAPIVRRAGIWMFAGTMLFAIASIGFGLSRNIWISIVCLGLAGAGDMISVFVRASLVQLATPDEMRGRISALSFLFISASNELGDFQSGVAGRIFGPVLAVAGGGVVAVGVCLMWMRLFKPLLHCDRFSDAEAYAKL